MGMSMGSAAGGGGSRRRRRGRKALNSDINVTPFVDVILCLLIIFMVAAPMLTVGVPLDLPETQAKALNSDNQPIEVSVQKGGAVFIGETEFAAEEIVAKLQAVARTGYEERIFVKADKAADYGSVIRVMALISAAGYKNIGLITAPETTS